MTFPLSNSSSHSSITVSLLALMASSMASLLTAETSPSQLRTGPQKKPLKAVFNWSTCVQTACPCLTVGAVGLIRGVPEQLFHDDAGLSPIPGHGSSTREGLSCFALSSLAAFVAVFHLAVPHDHRGYEWQTWINFGIAFSLITNARQLSHTFAMFAFFSVGGGNFFGRGLFCISITVVPIGASPALLLF